MARRNVLNMAAQESPVERARKSGPLGNGEWPGYAVVYSRIAAGCESMARNPYVHLSADHVESMADLGSGNENRMKSRQMWMRDAGYVA